jgi:hypothetical protein
MIFSEVLLHDAWRPVTEEEFDLAYKYAQRIVEDLYDDRFSVEALLKARGVTIDGRRDSIAAECIAAAAPARAHFDAAASLAALQQRRYSQV